MSNKQILSHTDRNGKKSNSENSGGDTFPGIRCKTKPNMCYSSTVQFQFVEKKERGKGLEVVWDVENG